MEEFNQDSYVLGFELALNHIMNEGLEYAERHAENLSGENWLSIGFRTAVDAYKEGASR